MIGPKRKFFLFLLAKNGQFLAYTLYMYGTYGLFSPIFTTNFGRLVEWSNVVNGLRPIYENAYKRHFKSAPLGLKDD